MKHAGPRMIPALVTAAIGALVLFLATTTWLEVLGAATLLAGAALIVANIATPDFLERDLDEDGRDDQA